LRRTGSVTDGAYSKDWFVPNLASSRAPSLFQ